MSEYDDDVLEGAQKTLCFLEDVAADHDREQDQLEFRAAQKALRHYRECMEGNDD